jgi:SpoVK/Ycf46/Vps4 family AAA+-type ATPase
MDSELSEQAEQAEQAAKATNGPSAKAASARKASISAALQRLPDLIQASSWGSAQNIREISHAIADDIDPHSPALAKKIRARFTAAPLAIKRLTHPEKLIALETPRHGLQDVVLPQGVADECRAILDEHAKRDDLRAFALDPRHKVLVYGPPGNGKTLLAEALAKELGVPFLRVRYSGLVDSHLGETAKHIDEVLEYAATAPCVLFFDEFDGVGADRNRGDVGELRRITNQLLIAMDRLPSHVMFIAATNAMQLVDKALARRFDFTIELPDPTPALMTACAQRELAPTLTPGHDLTARIPVIAGMGLQNLHAVVQLCRRLRRDLVLNNGRGVDEICGTNP